MQRWVGERENWLLLERVWKTEGPHPGSFSCNYAAVLSVCHVQLRYPQEGLLGATCQMCTALSSEKGQGLRWSSSLQAVFRFP